MRKGFAFRARLCSGGGELHYLRTFQIGRSFYSIRSFLRWDLFRRRRGCLLRELTWCVVSIRVDEFESVMSGGDGWK